jgi:hypothetical protein
MTAASTLQWLLILVTGVWHVPGNPGQVFGLEWNPHQVTHDIEPQFVTFGKKHVKMWKPAGNSWAATQLSFGKLPLQNVCAAVFLVPQGPQRTSLLLTGMADGQIYVFKVRGGLAVHVTSQPARPTWQRCST